MHAQKAVVCNAKCFVYDVVEWCRPYSTVFWLPEKYITCANPSVCGKKWYLRSPSAVFENAVPLVSIKIFNDINLLNCS